VKSGLSWAFDGAIRPDNVGMMKPLENKSEPSKEHAELCELVLAAVTALVDAEDQIFTFSRGGDVDAQGRQALDDIAAVTVRLRAWIDVFGDPKLDPWPALASAESAISDWDAALRKGYVADARRKIYGVMDALRAVEVGSPEAKQNV
jgi:hypothetical protein